MTTDTVVAIRGTVDPAWQEVGEVLARIAGTLGHGGALAIRHDGRDVVDLVVGDTRPDALQLIFSVSKAVTAIAAGMAEADGILDLDRPLAAYWPAFDRASTRRITARMVLAHRSGLAAVDTALGLDDLLAGRDVDAIERQEPYWEPDTAHGYHAVTFGTLLDGVFRRELGQRVGEFVAARIANALGLDLWIGAPEQVDARVQPITYAPRVVTKRVAAHRAASAIPAGTTAQIARTLDVYNALELRRLGLPSSSGVAGARDLALMLAATMDDIDGVRLLDAGALQRLTALRSSGTDLVLGVESTFGSGVQRPFPTFPMLSAASFGHEAAGGSAAVADPDLGLAVGFTTDRYPASSGVSPMLSAVLPTILHCAAHSDRPQRTAL